MQEPPQQTQSVHDPLDPARVIALHHTLGHSGTAPDTLPPLGHYLYFWDPQPPEALGRDGHPKVGDFIPDLGLPRRMWGGGRLTFHAPIALGQPAEKRSRIIRVTRKQGNSGPLGFVTLCHEFFQNGERCRIEEQDLIYREDPRPDAPAPLTIDAPMDEDHLEHAGFDSTQLFRYSALTFNGHRIHYDQDYCSRVEGYPGLVVHGPLLAQLLVDMAQRLIGPIASFKFRSTAPLFLFETAELCARERNGGLMLWVRGPDGRQCIVADATPHRS